MEQIQSGTLRLSFDPDKGYACTSLMFRGQEYLDDRNIPDTEDFPFGMGVFGRVNNRTVTQTGRYLLGGSYVFNDNAPVIYSYLNTGDEFETLLKPGTQEEDPDTVEALRVRTRLNAFGNQQIIELEVQITLSKPTVPQSNHYAVSPVQFEVNRKVAQRAFQVDLKRFLEILKQPNNPEKTVSQLGGLRISKAGNPSELVGDPSSFAQAWASGDGRLAIALYRSEPAPPLLNMTEYQTEWTTEMFGDREVRGIQSRDVAREDVAMPTGVVTRHVYLTFGTHKEVEDNLVFLHNAVVQDPPSLLKIEGTSELPL